MAARDLMVSLDHLVKAAWEDSTADWTSGGEERATEAMGWDVAGDNTGRYFSIRGAVCLPEIMLLILGSLFILGNSDMYYIVFV